MKARMRTVVQCAAAIAVAATLPATAGLSNVGAKCGLDWNMSIAKRQQGCDEWKVNYDRTTDGTHYCYHDVYCDAIPGIPNSRAGRKGLIDVLLIGDLRRCADDPSVIDTSCAPYRP